VVTGVPDAGRSLAARDGDVVKLVGRFGQVTSSHIRVLLFAGLAPTTLDRSISRLLKSNNLIRVGRRSHGAINGASPFVYQLGTKG
jgi:hypothetical protein